MAEEQAQATATQPEAQAQPQAQTTEAPAAPQLSISDLQALLNVIDVASSRGAFRANELTNVGSVADKLTKFLNHVAEQQKAQQEEQAKQEGGAEQKTEAQPEQK
jgi:hypothetical protein